MAAGDKEGQAASGSMILLDSNLLIYGASPERGPISMLIREQTVFISEISRIEVLGFHRITPSEAHALQSLFSLTTVIPITADVVDRAIALRQHRKMSLGDAIIAGTALVHDLTLATHNTKDFKWIDSLMLLDPLAAQ